jgi:hypothetical protein
MTDAEFRLGETVTVLIWAYKPGQAFWDEPGIFRRHRGTLVHTSVSDGVEVYWVDTWTGAGRVGVCRENICREDTNNG